jgi:hypothetical protein
MIEIKQPTTVLERVQNVYQEYPPAFWVLMTGTFIDRLGRNLIMLFLAIYVDKLEIGIYAQRSCHRLCM